MKNRFMKIIIVFLLLILVVPNEVLKAEENTYTSMTLKEACEQEDIDFNHDDYKESTEKVNVYVFRGNGCSHCHDLLTYLESIVEKQGKYFNVITYEVWENENNSLLMDKVSEYFGDTATGVPYLIIGNKTWVGYAQSIDEEIIDAITNQYESENKFDIINELNNINNGGEAISFETATIIILFLLNVFILVKIFKDKKELNNRISKLENIKKK